MRNRWQPPTPTRSLSLSHSFPLSSLPLSLSLWPSHLVSNLSYLSQCSNFTFQPAPERAETRLFCNRRRDNVSISRLSSFGLGDVGGEVQKSSVRARSGGQRQYIFHHNPWGEHVCACGFHSSFLNLSLRPPALLVAEGRTGWGHGVS